MQDLNELKKDLERDGFLGIADSLLLIARCEKSEELNTDLLRINKDWAARCESAEKELSRYSISAGDADQRLSESRAARVVLGLEKDGDDISPRDLVDGIDLIRFQRDSLAQEIKELREQKSADANDLEKSELMDIIHEELEHYMGNGLPFSVVESVDLLLAFWLKHNVAQSRDSAEPVAVPEGWKLVPIEPTEEMINSAHEKVGYIAEGFGSDHADHYRAMLSAAPKLNQNGEAHQ